MPRLHVPTMAAAAQRYGLTVEVVPGAETRGDTAFNPVLFVGHHTAGARTGARPSLNVCVNGRADLDGPLCNWFLDRNGVVVIVAAGRANHAGAGGYLGFVGNSAAQGCEAEDDGDGIWADAQLWAYPRLVAAGLDLMAVGPTHYCSHRTWAPTRKIDPAGISDDWMRRQVAAVRATPTLTAQEGTDDVSYDDAARALRDVLHLPTTGLAVPRGQRDNGNLYANLLGAAQANVNSVNSIRAGVSSTLAAVQSSSVVTGQVEQDVTTLLQQAAEVLAQVQDDDEPDVPPPTA